MLLLRTGRKRFSLYTRAWVQLPVGAEFCRFSSILWGLFQDFFTVLTFFLNMSTKWTRFENISRSDPFRNATSRGVAAPLCNASLPWRCCPTVTRLSTVAFFLFCRPIVKRQQCWRCRPTMERSDDIQPAHGMLPATCVPLKRHGPWRFARGQQRRYPFLCGLQRHIRLAFEWVCNVTLDWRFYVRLQRHGLWRFKKGQIVKCFQSEFIPCNIFIPWVKTVKKSSVSSACHFLLNQKKKNVGKVPPMMVISFLLRNCCFCIALLFYFSRP